MSDLAEQIDALLALNAKGAVSHPIPGLAVELLERARDTLSALPPVDGLEVVEELNRIISEEAADFADAAGHAIEAGERPDLWDREVEVSVHTLSQASSVIAGLTKERDHWKANHDQMVQRNSVLRERPDLPADRLPAIARYEAEIERFTKERDEIVEAANSYAHQAAKSEIALRDAEDRIASLEEEIKRLREIVKAVAHIGVDFGFGPYELEHHFIEDARQALGDHNG